MKTYKLAAAPRVDLGKKATKALRANNQIPAVISGGEIVELPYTGKLEEGQKVVEIENGKGLVTTDIVVTNDAVRKLIYSPEIFAVEIELNGNKKMAVLKDIQFHPVKDNILHIDFLEVNDKKPVVIEVPVKLVGHAEGVKAGGKLAASVRKLKVRAVYSAIPERLNIDVTNLGLGKTIKVGELSFEGLELVTSPSVVVCQVKMTRSAMSAAAKAQ